MTYGQPFVGTDNGPEYLRQAGLLENLTSIGWRVHDLGDLDFHVNPSEVDLSLEKSNAKNSQIVGKGCEVITTTFLYIENFTIQILIVNQYNIWICRKLRMQ